MPDYDDEEDQLAAPASSQTVTQPSPVEWGPALEASLSKVTNARNSLDSDLSAGKIEPGIYSDIANRLDKQAVPLKQAKQQSEKTARAKAINDSMENQAAADAINISKSKRDADSFQDSKVVHYDTMEGRITALQETDGKGGFRYKTVDPDHITSHYQHERDAAKQEGGPDINVGQDKWKGGEMQYVSGPSLEAFKAGQFGAQGKFEMTPAQKQVQEMFSRGGLPPKQLLDQAKADSTAQTRGMPHSVQLSEAEMHDMWARANNIVRMPEGPQKQAMVGRVFDHMMTRAQAGMQQSMMQQQRLQEQGFQREESRKAREHVSQEIIKAREAADRGRREDKQTALRAHIESMETGRKEAATKHLADSFRHYHSEAIKQVQKAQESFQTAPEHLNTPQKINDWAHEQAMNEVSIAHGFVYAGERPEKETKEKEKPTSGLPVKGLPAGKPASGFAAVSEGAAKQTHDKLGHGDHIPGQATSDAKVPEAAPSEAKPARGSAFGRGMDRIYDLLGVHPFGQ